MYFRFTKRDRSDEIIRRLERINLLSQKVIELKIEIDNIFARRENFSNYVREGVDANGRLGEERVSDYLAALRDEQTAAEARLGELEHELEELKRDCEDE